MEEGGAKEAKRAGQAQRGVHIALIVATPVSKAAVCKAHKQKLPGYPCEEKEA